MVTVVALNGTKAAQRVVRLLLRSETEWRWEPADWSEVLHALQYTPTENWGGSEAAKFFAGLQAAGSRKETGARGPADEGAELHDIEKFYLGSCVPRPGMPLDVARWCKISRHT